MPTEAGQRAFWLREGLMGLLLVAVVSLPAFGQAAAPAGAAATRELYLEHCAKCHGPSGIPKPIAKDAQSFVDPKWSPPIEKVIEAIANGQDKKMMKGFKARLTAEQITRLAEFVLTLKDRKR